MSEQTIQFTLPPDLEARQPTEHRGLRRDQVRLLVLARQGDKPPIHTRFEALGDYLLPGDLLVVNTSRTLPALLQAKDEYGRRIEVRLARRHQDDEWEALLLEDQSPVVHLGEKLIFNDLLTASVLGRHADQPFLWSIKFDRCCMPLLDLIYRLGKPVRYRYVDSPLPLDLYQTVYASEPGSVEMPSAGRPFSWELLLKLRRKGIGLASISLHTGLSSAMDDVIDRAHPNIEEEFTIPEETAQAVNLAHRQGRRVIAVGTTVVRALETAALPSTAHPDGRLHALHGSTRLHISRGFQLRAVDALLTGLHEPQASHLDLLSAFIEPARLQSAYLEAIRRRYLWHEFGDINLII